MKKLIIFLLIILGNLTLLHSQILVDTICYGIEDLQILAQNNIERQYCEKEVVLLNESIVKYKEVIVDKDIQIELDKNTIRQYDSTITELEDYTLYLQNNNRAAVRTIKLQTLVSLIIIITVCLL